MLGGKSNVTDENVFHALADAFYKFGIAVLFNEPMPDFGRRFLQYAQIRCKLFKRFGHLVPLTTLYE